MVDIASLGIRVDATSADQAAKSLDGLTASGERTEAQMQRTAAAQKAFVDAAKAGQSVSAQVVRDAGGYAAAQKLLEQSLGKTGAATAAVGNATVAASAVMGAHGKAVGNTRAQYEALVLVHELLQGRTTRMTGSLLIMTQAMLGAGGAGKLLAFALNPVTLLVAGLTGGLIAGAIAANQYATQMRALSDLAEGIGAKVGNTTAGLQAAAQDGAKAASISVGAAMKQAQAYAATGEIGQAVIGGLIGITDDYAKLTGEKVPAAQKELAASFADPAKGAEDLNSKFGFLNVTQLQHIETMARSGDQLGAQRALFAALDPVMTNTEAHLREQTSLWHNLAAGIGNAWTALGQFLSGEGRQNRVGQLQTAISNIQRQAGGGPISGVGQGLIAQYQKEIDAITASAQHAQVAVSNIAINKGQSVVNQYDLTGAAKLTDLQSQLATVTAALTQARLHDKDAVAGLTETQTALTRAVQTYVAPAQKAHDVALAQAQAAAATTPAQKAAAAAALVRANAEGEVATASQISQKAQDAATTATDRAAHSHLGHAEAMAREAEALAADVTATLAAASAYLKSTTAGEKAEAARKALTQAVKDGLSPAQEAAKIAASEALANAQAIEALAKKATALADQVRDQAALNALVAAGAMTVAQASQQLAIENQLRDDNARLARLTGAAHDVLEAAIRKETAALVDSNAQKRIEQDLSGRDTARDRAAALDLEASMIGRTNAERAIALAQLEAEQRLRAQGYDATTSTPDEARAAQQAIDAAKAQAKAQVDLNQTTADYNATLDQQLALMTEIADQAHVLGDNLSKAFGSAGDALSGLLTAQTDYAAKLAQIDKDRTEAGLKYAKDSAAWNAAIQKADADTTSAKALHDGQVLESAKNLFGQQSAAYKALAVIQQVYYAEQFALQARAIIVDTAHTIQSVANSGLRAAADGAAAFAKTLASLPFPFNLAAGATVVAALAAVGVRLFGGGGGGSSVQSASDYQKTVGTGTVLGSPQAQSDSISRSLDDAAKDQNQLLQVNNSMLDALRAIQNNIGHLTSAIARQLSLSGGAFDTSGLGLGSTSGHPALGYLLGGIGGLLFKSSTTKTLLDQGISFSPQQLSQLLAGVADQTYQTIETKKSTSFLGIGLSSSDKVNTTNGSVDSDLNRQIQLVVGSLRDGVVSAATALGIDGAKATLDAFNVDLGKLSFKDLDAKGIQDELNAAFSKLGDQMAQAVAPFLAHFQQAGEGTMDTLVRLANEFQVTDQVFAQLGVTFTALGVNGLDARDQLVQLAGGLDNFTSAANAYVQAFLTDQQQLVPIAAAVTKAMNGLGLSGVATKTQFEAVVSGLDLTTAGGRALYTQLMQIAPAFAKVADAAEQLARQRQDLEITYLQATGDALGATALQRQKELAALDASLKPLQMAIYAAQDLTAANDTLATAQQHLAQLQAQAAQEAAQAVQGATQALTDAYNQQASALQDTVNSLGGYVTSLQQYRHQLDQGAGSGLSLAQQYSSAKSQFEATARAARGGDTKALGNLQNVAQAFLTTSAQTSGSSLAYQRDVAKVKAAIDQAANGAQAQVGIAERQLSVLQAQVSGLITINQSVLSIPVAIANLQQALIAQAAANANVPSTSLQQQIADAQAAVAAAQKAVDAAKAITTTANQNLQPTTPTSNNSIMLHDASGAALAYSVGVPTSAGYYSSSEQAAKRGAAMSGAYDNDNAFWDRFFGNNSDLQTRYASLIAGGMTSGHASTQSTGGDASWQWVRDLYKGGQFGDRALYAGGGYTGPGGVLDVAGLVHRGEVVWSQVDVARAGGVSAAEALRHGWGSRNDNGLLEELRALRQEVAQLRAENMAGQIAIAKSTGQSAKLQKRWDGDGLPATRSVAS